MIARLSDLLTGASARPAWSAGAQLKPRQPVMLDPARREAADKALEPLGLSVDEIIRRAQRRLVIRVPRMDTIDVQAIAKAAAAGMRRRRGPGQSGHGI